MSGKNEIKSETLAATGPAEDDFIINLDRFTGPLDLLLHLIKEHEMDIFDIPISEISEKYLAYMEGINEMNLDGAGDFLLMAATLAHIKSKMLLPPSGDDEDDDEDNSGDPREELVRRLLEYQKYKDAAAHLDDRPLLGRDVYHRPLDRSLAAAPDQVEIEDVSVFQLIEVFQELLDKAKIHAPHQVRLDTVSVESRIREILKAIGGNEHVTFRSLFSDVYSRSELVGTFLAILELARILVLRIFQTVGGSEIYLSRRPDSPSDEEIERSISMLEYDKEIIEKTEEE